LDDLSKKKVYLFFFLLFFFAQPTEQAKVFAVAERWAIIQAESSVVVFCVGGGVAVSHARKLSHPRDIARKIFTFCRKKTFRKLHFFLDSYGLAGGRAP
jgi:predicted small integral membrane protein